MEEPKLKQDVYYSMIKDVLEKLEKEGVEATYRQFHHGKYSNGSSRYSALVNDLIGCCPDSEEWKNPRVRERYRQDVLYYCKYHMDYYEE